MIYFTSDLHLGHNNIIKLANRPFTSAEEMDESLITNINVLCSKRDTLYILGDISFRQLPAKTEEQLSLLNPEIILIRGNHDPESYENLQEVFDYKELKIYHRKVVLSHYPFLEWNGMYSESLHLHGHQHNHSDYNESMRAQHILRYDVGVDANNYFPVSARQIFEFFGLSTDDYNNSMKRR